MKILIKGFGLSAAVLAQQAMYYGCEVTITSENIEGGLVASYETEDGIVVHKYGPHIFHTSDKAIWDYVNRFTEWVPYINTPVALYKNKYYNLPFNLHTFQQLFGAQNSEDAKKFIENDSIKLEDSEIKNAKDSALSSVGKKIYKTLIETYTKKQWGVNPEKLDRSVLDRLPLRFTWNNNYFNDLYQALPLSGYFGFLQSLADGANFISKKSLAEIEPGYDKIFICEALDKALDYTFGKIPYLKTLFEVSSDKTEAAVVNICDKSSTATRKTNFGLLWPIRRGNNFVLTETPLRTDPSPETTERAYAEDCYPCLDTTLYNKYFEYCKEHKYIPVGRLAENKYLNMDQAIKNAIDVASKELEYLLWL